MNITGIDIGHIVLVVLLCVMRIFGMKALLFFIIFYVAVGNYMGAWLVSRRQFYLFMWIALTVVDVICYLIGTFR